MSSNKSIRQLMERKYGKKCMMEEAGIRYIPVEERRIKGYKKTDEQITYHHLRPRSNGGQATEENGAILKSYNHQWLEQQPKAVREKINNQLSQYKEDFVKMSIPKQPNKEDYTEIEAYDTELQNMIFEDNLMEMRL